MQHIPNRYRTQHFRAFVWTLWALPLIQCLTAGLATPKSLALAPVASSFLFWLCAICPLWWLTHFCSKLVLANTGVQGYRLWLGLAIAGIAAFLISDLLGYFYWLDQTINRWVGTVEPPWTIVAPDLANISYTTAFFGATGHALIWLSANASARFLLGTTIYARESGSPTQIPTFMHRLPEELRHNVLAIQAQEHYITVHTGNGSELILYRFGDALKELDDSSGVQVHRSFWVAFGSVVDHQRKNGQLFLTLKNGLEVPVSRSFARDVEQSPLLMDAA